MRGAFYTGRYRNIFAELGRSEAEVQERIESAFETLFFGGEDERIYHECGKDMGYLVDTGNNDVRTEGQSYGMMIAVQMNRKDIFDRIWKWTRTYMYLDKGDYKGYFGWSARLDGKLNSTDPHPTAKNILPWRSCLQAGGGATVRGYSTIPLKPGIYCVKWCIKRRTRCLTRIQS